MRFHLSHSLLTATLSLGIASSAFASTAEPALSTQPIPSVQHYWQKVDAQKEFFHLSNHGQLALLSILEAHHNVAAGQVSLAVPALMAANTHLIAASQAQERFKAAEAVLHPAPQHPVSPHHTPQTGPTDWIPVSGDIVASTTLSADQKERVAIADALLKTGKSQQAAQMLKDLRHDVDYIVALAPLQKTQQAVNRALTFAKGNNAPGVKAALTDILDSFVFVSENVISDVTAAKSAHR